MADVRRLVFAYGFSLLLFSGCSTIGGIVENDLARTSELAAAYGKPAVKECADFLRTALDGQDGLRAQLEKLLAEPTSGLLSRGFKAVLVAELVKSLQDPARQAQFEKQFKEHCSEVAGQMLLHAAREAKDAFARGR